MPPATSPARARRATSKIRSLRGPRRPRTSTRTTPLRIRSRARRRRTHRSRSPRRFRAPGHSPAARTPQAPTRSTSQPSTAAAANPKPWPTLCARPTSPETRVEPLPSTSPTRSSERPLAVVADDEKDILLLVATVLQTAGFDVIGARNGVEALTEIRVRQPQLAVLDLSMPELDGLEVLRRVRADAGVAKTPIVILSAR